jgi:hypothetical protein
MRTTRAFRLWAIAGAVFLMGCPAGDNAAERAKHECGFPGNGCWSDTTCNTGSTCNVTRKNETLAAGVCPAEHGVCELRPDATAADGKQSIDVPKPSPEARPDQSSKPEQMNPDTAHADTAHADTAHADTSHPDTSHDVGKGDQKLSTH